ncbi:hypothetical protein QYF36_020632 [Acer negundo]|nr:hypothetical protein QYF36_020632 [Acer negundo]
MNHLRPLSSSGASPSSDLAIGFLSNLVWVGDDGRRSDGRPGHLCYVARAIARSSTHKLPTNQPPVLFLRLHQLIDVRCLMNQLKGLQIVHNSRSTNSLANSLAKKDLRNGDREQSLVLWADDEEDDGDGRYGVEIEHTNLYVSDNEFE